MHWLDHFVRHALEHWGYLAILAGLLGENAGLPLPGETILMFASFLAHKDTHLKLYWVIAVGTGAAIMGDNIGFFVGHKLGKTLIRWLKKLFRLDDDDVGAAKEQFRRHGAGTVFWARYVFGLRTIAGPMAGMLGMEWKRFVLFNALGAVTWVTTIALSGYLFANHFNSLLEFFEKASWAIAGGLSITGYLVWRHKKKKYKQKHDHPKAA